MEKITEQLSKMLSGDKLISEMSVYPKLDVSISDYSTEKRLLSLLDIYKIYIPSKMSIEIYNKLYTSIFQSMQKKELKISIKQHYENFKAIKGEEYNGIIGGADNFTIIGVSGIGKSSAINRTISLITKGGVIETKENYSMIIPFITIQCPFDSSVKGMLLEILRKVDETIGTKYYMSAIRARATIDMLIGSVSQVALNHIGLIIVDEIQNVVNSKNGKNLIGALTQLINNSGTSICMVGTPESINFFDSAIQLSRRSVGLEYLALNYDDYFENFCKIIFNYQYTKTKTKITPLITQWLYEHSAGIISLVISLIHDAQEIAIMSGKEVLNLETLNYAYEQRLRLMHKHINNSIKQKTISANRGRNISFDNKIKNQNIKTKKIKISELVTKAQNEDIDIVNLLKENFQITEVII